MSRSPPITPQPQSQVQSFSSPTQSCLPALPPLPSPSNSRLIHGPWKPSEIERLRTLVSFSTDVEDGAPIDHVDWTWVVDNFGGTRNRHQVLIKAVELGLRESSTHHSRKIKQKGYREALEAMQSDLHEASTKPLPSPLPSLLPSARINQTFNTLRIGSVRRLTSDSSPGEQEAPRKRYKLALSPSELSGIRKDEAVRRESSSTASSDDLKTPDRSPLPPQSRAIPRALDLSLSADIKSPKSQDDRARLSTPKRPTTASLALSAGSPKTPKSTLRSMAFKPYAHPRATAVNEGSHAAADVPPATAPARSTCPRAWDGAWGMVALPGVRADGRPSILSPSFGSFDAGIGKEAGGRGEGVDVNVGYQPLLDGPVSGRRASHD
ncbi:hypothetical protein I316_01047 [Kwoniella heveanensis BCC8398]|uniref:Myb-like domain-containing protein n=1 Tax=Kwoniella heveanensis BCC8398 TaxID=1296120 RepID=A0A1B9H1L0_9TREE|nr:hypothetical protein I316_01047 [Kwoniella heveanensis BCC8398]